MTGELFINDKDAFTEWGVNMGNGFINALNTPCATKDYIENESRLLHGKTIITKQSDGNSLVRIASRTLSLTFTIMATDLDDLDNKRKAFVEELYKGEVTLHVKGDRKHYLYYKSANSYSQNYSGTFCQVVVKFDEPNPTE